MQKDDTEAAQSDVNKEHTSKSSESGPEHVPKTMQMKKKRWFIYWDNMASHFRKGRMMTDNVIANPSASDRVDEDR